MKFTFFDIKILKFSNLKFIVENGLGRDFQADPSEGTAYAFRFDQSERDATGAFFALGLWL